MTINKNLYFLSFIALVIFLGIYVEKISMPPQQDSIAASSTDVDVPVLMTLNSPKSKFTVKVPVKLERINNFDTILKVSEYAKETKMWGGKYEQSMNTIVEYIEFDKNKIDPGTIVVKNMFQLNFMEFQKRFTDAKIMSMNSDDNRNSINATIAYTINSQAQLLQIMYVLDNETLWCIQNLYPSFKGENGKYISQKIIGSAKIDN